jgi:hypothetical protein
MGFAQSIVGLQWAFPVKRQSAYATANPELDIVETHPFEGADIIEHNPNMSENSAQLGRGHEFATRLDIMTWDTMMRRSFTATSKIVGWAMAFHLGKLTSTNLGGSPSAYQHVMEYQDHNGAGYYSSGRQQPVFTVVEQVTSGYIRKFPSMQIKAVEMTAQLGDWLRLTVEAQGSGMKTTLSGFSFPDQSVAEGERLRFAGLTFNHQAVGGGTTDISCDVRSFRFRSEYQYFENDGYCPGSGYLTSADANSGQIRNKLEFGRRACLLEFTVRADASDDLFDRLEGRTEMEAELIFTGGVISGANAHKVTLDLPRIRYRAVPIGTDGDLIVYNVQGLLLYDGTMLNPFEVTVVNVTPAMLVSS